MSEKLKSGSENLCLGGLSNTPLDNSFSIENNVCIDYLKIRFNSLFSPLGKCWKKLIEALRCSPDVYDDDIKVTNYKKCYVFDANVFIYCGGDTTQNSEGEDTSILELKGQACREFEKRGGSWIDLFDEIIKLKGICKRVDLALDDFSNTINLKGMLNNKIRKGLYTSIRKSDPVIQESSNGGLSITFGKFADRTLCIYNKNAERKNKGFIIGDQNWVRYEARFKGDFGDEAFAHAYESLVNNELDITTKKLIKGMLEIKEGNYLKDEHNLMREKNWSDWDKLLDVNSRIKLKNQAKVEATISRKINWLNRSATKNRIICELLTKDEYSYIDGYFVFNHINKLKNRDIASLNYSLISLGKDPITLDDAKDYLFKKYVGDSNPNELVVKILGFDEKTGEIKK